MHANYDMVDVTSRERNKAYYFGGLEQELRFGPYLYAHEPKDFNQIARMGLGLHGSEAVLDVGCGSGKFLRYLSNGDDASVPHEGLLVGVDIVSLEEDPRVLVANRRQRKIHFVRADVLPLLEDNKEGGKQWGSLPFQPEVFDAISVQFMAYHVEEPEMLFRSLGRLLKPDGRMVITTSGPGNKQKHREFEVGIASYLTNEERKIAPPPRFTANFNTTIAERLLPRLFEYVEIPYAEQKTVMEIDVKPSADGLMSESLERYWFSLKSMADHFLSTPIAGYAHLSGKQPFSYIEYNEAINDVVIPAMREQADDQGIFRDTIDRAAYVCSKPLG